jgi:trypsin
MKRVRPLFSALLLVLSSRRRHLSYATESIARLVRDEDGIATERSGGRDLVVGGHEAPEDRHSYVVSLQLGGRHFCGGSLVARDVVLTAAHCRQGGGYDVVLGRHDFRDSDGEVIPVKRESCHPNYNEEETDNDFMLLFLERPTRARNVGLVRLNSDGSVPSAGQQATDMGWGDMRIEEEIHVNSDVLRRAHLSVLSNEDCDSTEGWYYDPATGWTFGSTDNYITDNMLCTWAYKRGSCQGDSGGPLVVRGSGGPRSDLQVGISSWMIDCASDDFPGVYARVSRAYDWIEREVCDGSEHASETGFDCGDDDDDDDDDDEGGGDDDGGHAIEEIPSDADATPPCPVCPDGLTVPASRIIPYPEAGGSSCAELLEYASRGVRRKTCVEMMLAEAICCPPPTASPCRVCSNGITVDGALPVFEGSAKTCGDLAVDSKVTEDGSEECDRMRLVEPVCCPAGPGRSYHGHYDNW